MAPVPAGFFLERARGLPDAAGERLVRAEQQGSFLFTSDALGTLGVGVPYAVVRQDYLQSNGAPGMEALRSQLASALPDLPPDVSIALYRVVQEALANVRKYAQASVVRVALHREAEHLRLVIEDDGVGIRDDALGRPASHGLVGMRERLRVLGGTFEIRRGEGGRGTVIDAIAPRPV